MEVLEDDKKYNDTGELESHIITIKLDGNLDDAIYAIVCANKLYYNKESKQIDFIGKAKAETRIEFAIELLQKELKKINKES